ncbi:MAG: SulP family inorganic anion transporter, partial [Cyanobacteriota bacterium]|nr:SulP family inorganic anion transporter [Cyanobacteriota bacterium]
MAFTVVMMAGVFQILLGSLRLGRYITMMPYTVISGFMSGIGIILIILQTAPFLGQDSPKGGVVGTVTSLPELFNGIQPLETILAAMTVAIIVLTPSKWKRNFPPQLAALIVGTAVSLIFFGGQDIRRIDDVAENIAVGLPSLHMPEFTASELRLMFVDAVVLGMLGCIDALLTSLVADSLTRTEHNSNKELIGQGLGNIASGLFGGIAGAGATMGTVVNIQTGGRTALSGLTRAAVLFIVVAFLAPQTQFIPLAVLAGIALKVGIDIIDWGFLMRAHKISWKAALIMYGVILLTVFVDLIVAVGVGVFVANILTIERLSNLRAESVKAITYDDEEIELAQEEKELLDRADGRVVLFYLSGPMIFGVSKAIAREHNAVDNFDALILDLSDVPILGVTASLALENAIKEAIEKGRRVYVVGATGKALKRLQTLNVPETIGPENMVQDRTEALRQAVALVEARSESYSTEPSDAAVASS